MFGSTAEIEASFMIDLSNRPIQAGEYAVERFAYVLILGITWGTEWSRWIQDTLVRESVPCTLFWYRGTFSDRQFSEVLVPLQTGDPCRLAGAADGCYCWAGYTHDLVALPWILGAGFGCINCKDTLHIRKQTRCCIRCLFGFCLELAARCLLPAMHTIFNVFLFRASCLVQLVVMSCKLFRT